MADQRVMPALGALSAAGEGFVEFLSGAKAGVVDVDVAAGGGDHLLGNVIDFDGLSHVQDEDLAVVSDESGLQDEVAGLGDGHEVAGGLGVGDGDWAAVADLVAEGGQDASAAAEDVAEPDGQVAAGS